MNLLEIENIKFVITEQPLPEKVCTSFPSFYPSFGTELTNRLISIRSTEIKKTPIKPENNLTKEVKLWKHTFIKNITDKGGAKDKVFNELINGNVFVRIQNSGKGQLWGQVKPEELLKLIENDKGVYEVITFPCKVFFDIDLEKENFLTEELHIFEEYKQRPVIFLSNIIKIILGFFPLENDYAISGSISIDKISYHIVLNNYVIENKDQYNTLNYLVQHIKSDIDNSFDKKIYTTHRYMKCINQSKQNEAIRRIQEPVMNDDPKKHIITAFLPTEYAKFPEFKHEIHEAIMLEKSTKHFDMGELPKLELKTPVNFNIDTITPIEILQLLPIDKSFNHNYTHLIARFCYNNDIKIETFLEWIQHKHNPLTVDIKKKWFNHFKQLDKYPKVSINKIIAILSKFYKDIKKPLPMTIFEKTFELPVELIRNIDRLEPSHFEFTKEFQHDDYIEHQFIEEFKYLLYCIGMGGGKTEQTALFLQNKTSFLWIAPIISLAENTKLRLHDKNIDCVLYKDIHGIENKNQVIPKARKLIITLNSLHYIADAKYDIVVIDEVETLLDKMLGDFINKQNKKLIIWNTFLRVLRQAKRVILLDAFITTKTLNFIKDIENDKYIPVIFKRNIEPCTRTVYYVQHFEVMILEIIEKLNQGLKIFVYYPYKEGNCNVWGMEQLLKTILANVTRENVTGMFYNASVGDNDKKQLKNVNENWSKHNLIVVNNVITCGVNYEIQDFDFKYLFVAPFSNPRDIVQVSYRSRYLSTGIIKIYFMGKMTGIDAYEKDFDLINNCSKYVNLYNSIMIEKFAPIKDALNLFFRKANYIQLPNNDKQLSKELESQYDKLLFLQGNSYRYDSIKDIDFSIYDHYKSVISSNEATYDMKMEAQKYLFNEKFIQEIRDVIFRNSIIGPLYALNYIWDTKLSNCADKLAELQNMPFNVFEKIKACNNLDTIFPVDILKTKLTVEIIDEIFITVKFKNLNKKSCCNTILKDFYNTYFGYHVITTTYEKNRRASYHINEDMDKLYDIVKRYYKIRDIQPDPKELFKNL